ncbi:MAG: sigma-54 dependent transcriptional regulator [Gammaproteobacteria bacterium]|nr:sigma-54 dependent transcriptional regulator [Gammaproteobacteria bacterium]
MAHILVVEPDSGYRDELCDLLQRHGYAVESAARFPQSLSGRFQAVVANARLPFGASAGIPLILIADEANIRAAVNAMRDGAADYLPRPFDHGELLEALERVTSHNASRSPGHDTWLLKGSCRAMRELFERIEKVAPTESTVLIEGEPGTGKELVARALHAAGQRRQAPLISLNCAATPQSLIESELFGHGPADEPAAGLLQAAGGGTLFLKEVGELPLPTQDRLVSLLRASGTRQPHLSGTDVDAPLGWPDVRLISATHRDISHLAMNGQFRHELFDHLKEVSLAVPPLRSRGEDIVELAQALLDRHSLSMNKPGLRFSDEAMAAMSEYHWPGNLRELENAVERAVILSDDATIGSGLLAIDAGRLHDTAMPDGGATVNNDNPEDHVSLQDYFVRFVTDNQDRFTETELAAKLGISRKNLWERRKRYSIPRRRTRTRRPRRDIG